MKDKDDKDTQDDGGKDQGDKDTQDDGGKDQGDEDGEMRTGNKDEGNYMSSSFRL